MKKKRRSSFMVIFFEIIIILLIITAGEGALTIGSFLPIIPVFFVCLGIGYGLDRSQFKTFAAILLLSLTWIGGASVLFDVDWDRDRALLISVLPYILLSTASIIAMIGTMNLKNDESGGRKVITYLALMGALLLIPTVISEAFFNGFLSSNLHRWPLVIAYAVSCVVQFMVSKTSNGSLRVVSIIVNIILMSMGLTMTFYFGGPPQYIATLATLGIFLVNNKYLRERLPRLGTIYVVVKIGFLIIFISGAHDFPAFTGYLLMILWLGYWAYYAYINLFHGRPVREIFASRASSKNTPLIQYGFGPSDGESSIKPGLGPSGKPYPVKEASSGVQRKPVTPDMPGPPSL